MRLNNSVRTRFRAYGWLLALIVVSCHQGTENEIVPVGTTNVTVEDGITSFRSADDYVALLEGEQPAKDVLIQHLAASKNYVSLRKRFELNGASPATTARALTDEENEIAETNEFMSSILNEDAMVDIGEHIFKVDAAAEQVLVLKKEYANEIDDLRNRNLNNGHVMVFSTSDDVLLMLSEGMTGSAATLGGRAELFCFSGGFAATDKADHYDNSPYVSGLRQDNKVVYQQFGIYFSIQMKTKVQLQGWTGIWGSLKTSDQVIRYWLDFRPRCKDWSTRRGDIPDDGEKNELNYRPYESSRALRNYKLNAFFYGQGYWSREYKIESL